jgi:predicted RNase H-related nuclease YkuK (DUF458 family)
MVHQDTGGRVYVGTDSFIRRDVCIFASAICLYNEETRSGGSYFFKREKVNMKDIHSLRDRMTLEAQKSIDLACNLNKQGLEDLEIHLDISPKGSPHPTGKFAEALSGYARGTGFECKVKPQAWAAQVADKHSK